jgi:hypothetical protein
MLSLPGKLLSHASPAAKIPKEISEKVKSYGLGVLSQWSPQQYILLHPVSNYDLLYNPHRKLTLPIRPPAGF